jgi:tetratricopeptide (TPR) repeat protein
VQYTPEHLQALADTALAHEEKGFGLNKEAIAHMNEAVKLYPDSAVTHYYLGEAFPSRTPEQKAAYQKAAELGDDRTVAAAKERLIPFR